MNMPTGDTSLHFVTVGNPGNAADTTPGYTGAQMSAITYQMGTYDIDPGPAIHGVSQRGGDNERPLWFVQPKHMASSYATFMGRVPRKAEVQGTIPTPYRRHGQRARITCRYSMSPGAMRRGSATGCKTASLAGGEGNSTTETGRTRLTARHRTRR